MPSGEDGAALDVRHLSKSFGAYKALKDVDILIDRGEIHALLGENGSGKSTLIKVLAGYHDPDPGASVVVGGHPLKFGSPDAAYELGCRFVHQDLGLINSLTVAENLLLVDGFPTRFGTISHKRERSRVTDALSRLELDTEPDTPVGELAPSVRAGVAIARALGFGESRTKLLVLDEPTATLTELEAGRLLEIARAAARSGVGILYVSHNLDEILGFADTVSVLRDGVLVARRDGEGVTHAEIVHMMVGDELDQIRELADEKLADEPAPPTLVVSNLCSTQLDGVSLSVRPGEVVGVAGITGSGREALLGAIFGVTPRNAGTVVIAGKEVQPGRADRAVAAGLVLLPSDRKRLSGIMTLTARENFSLSDVQRFWKPPFLRLGRERSEAAGWFQKLDIRPHDGLELPLSSLSGGNQQKLLFGKWMRCAPKAFLLDEPTQAVDIKAKALLHTQILEAASRGVAVLICSTDVDELVALCSRVLVLRDGQAIAELKGSELSAARVMIAALRESGEVENAS